MAVGAGPDSSESGVRSFPAFYFSPLFHFFPFSPHDTRTERLLSRKSSRWSSIAHGQYRKAEDICESAYTPPQTHPHTHTHNHTYTNTTGHDLNLDDRYVHGIQETGKRTVEKDRADSLATRRMALVTTEGRVGGFFFSGMFFSFSFVCPPPRYMTDQHNFYLPTNISSLLFLHLHLVIFIFYFCGYLGSLRREVSAARESPVLRKQHDCIQLLLCVKANAPCRRPESEIVTSKSLKLKP